MGDNKPDFTGIVALLGLVGLCVHMCVHTCACAWVCGYAPAEAMICEDPGCMIVYERMLCASMRGLLRACS